jgi:hypothetical protein
MKMGEASWLLDVNDGTVLRITGNGEALKGISNHAGRRELDAIDVG